MIAPIRSFSGIRGIVGQTMTALESYKTTLAFYQSYLRFFSNNCLKIIIGTDAKISGVDLVMGAVSAFREIGRKEHKKIEIVYLGITSTPILQWSVKYTQADGGVMFTASHNPVQWNGIKLISGTDEFGTLLKPFRIKKVIQELDKMDKQIERKQKKMIEKRISSTTLPSENKITEKFNQQVIAKVENIIDKYSGIKGKGQEIFEKIRRRNFRIVIDACSRTGAQIPRSFLLSLGINSNNIIVINNKNIENCNRRLEPAPKYLTKLKKAIKKYHADVGFALDPDQDRLVCMPLSSEEHTPLLAGKFLIGLQESGNKTKHIKKIPVNLSTTSAWEEIAKAYNVKILRTPIGEINVADSMLKNSCPLGIEGNGGVILGDINHGRNSTVGMILILSYLAETGKTLKELESELPQYLSIKKKIKFQNACARKGVECKALSESVCRSILTKERKHISCVDRQDGYKFFFKDNSWLQIRTSNTEPIMRIFAEIKIDKSKEIARKKLRRLVNLTKIPLTLPSPLSSP